MRTQFVGALVTVLLTAALGNAQNASIFRRFQKFPSPDGAMIVVIHSAGVLEATRESRVEVRSHSGRVLAKCTYFSADGEHGYGVTKAAWTPDSQFFVYSLASSGGHQSWHTPVLFFSRRSSKIVSLDDLLKDAISNPQFEISAPDRITVILWSTMQTKTVSLGQIR